MMGIGAREAAEMSLWEYEARLYHWNKIHSVPDKDGGGPVVSHDITEAKIAQLKAMPGMLSANPPQAGKRERAKSL